MEKELEGQGNVLEGRNTVEGRRKLGMIARGEERSIKRDCGY